VCKKKSLLAQQTVQKKRPQHTHEKLMTDLSLSEQNSRKNFLQLDGPTFDELLKTVTPTIAKINTNMQKAVTFND
jgi:hypothetical protein